MDRKKIEDTVLDVLSTILQQPFKAGENANRENNPNWDSLKHMEIMFALEDELSVEFPEDSLAGLDSAEKIINAVLAYHAA